MEFLFKEEAEKDLDYWHQTNRLIIKRIESFLKSINQNPFNGIGHPKPLKGNLSGYWSRRINRKHRIIYSVGHNTITIYSARDHYDDK